MRNGSTRTRCGALRSAIWRSCQVLVDEADLALLQVAEPAVHELRALRRRARREVVALDERGAQAPAGGVERDAGAGDPAADDEHVELLGCQASERLRPVEGRRPARRVHCPRLPPGRASGPAPNPGRDELVALWCINRELPGAERADTTVHHHRRRRAHRAAMVARDVPAAAVVLVHGFTASTERPRRSATWRKRCTPTALDVVCYDARGHGTSEGQSTLGDLERHDVAAAVDAAREAQRPRACSSARRWARSLPALRRADADGLAGVVSVSCPAQWRLPRNVQGVLAAGLTRTRVRPRRGVAAGWACRSPRAGRTPSRRSTLVPKVQAPVAFLHGAADRFVPASDAAELLRGRERAAPPRSIVPDLGHAFAPQSVAADPRRRRLGARPLDACPDPLVRLARIGSSGRPAPTTRRGRRGRGRCARPSPSRTRRRTSSPA